MRGKKEPKKYVQGKVKETTYEKFQRITIRRHGVKHGHTGKGLQEALELYIKKYGDDLHVP